MRSLRALVVPVVLFAVACDTQAKEQLRQLAHVDSLRTDSIVAIKNDLLSEVMASTQFVNELNTEISKVRLRQSAKLNTKLSRESDLAAIKEERAAVVARIKELVARLDSSEKRVASLRTRAASLAKRDSTLTTQVAEYMQTITDLRASLEQQKAQYEATITKQSEQIVVLTAKVDTVTRDNVRLAGEKLALTDTVAQLTTEKNLAYYVIGTRDELVKQGVLVEEGRKRFLVLGGRSVQPARDVDATKFTKIDRLHDRVINFPEGEYRIFSRQNPTYASPFSANDGKMSGGLRIDEPERFWEPSKFLIIIKS